MAKRNSNPNPSSEQTKPVTLLAYNPQHENILIGEVPMAYFAMHRQMRLLLEVLPATGTEHDLAVNAFAAAESLWFLLMQLGKESHTVNPTIDIL